MCYPVNMANQIDTHTIMVLDQKGKLLRIISFNEKSKISMEKALKWFWINLWGEIKESLMNDYNLTSLNAEHLHKFIFELPGFSTGLEYYLILSIEDIKY